MESLQVKTGANNDSLSRMTVRRAGLYHFAILLSERKFLADMLQNLNDKCELIHFDGLQDHQVSESIYISDPTFNRIKIYRDRPRSEWKWKGTQVEMATLPLNTADLLKGLLKRVGKKYLIKLELVMFTCTLAI